jgi:hypothetical protein
MSAALIAMAAGPRAPSLRAARCIASQAAGTSSAGRPSTTSRNVPDT